MVYLDKFQQTEPMTVCISKGCTLQELQDNLIRILKDLEIDQEPDQLRLWKSHTTDIPYLLSLGAKYREFKEIEVDGELIIPFLASEKEIA